MCNCNAENRICNINTVIEKKPRAIDLMVIVVGEKLGLVIKNYTRTVYLRYALNTKPKKKKQQ